MNRGVFDEETSRKPLAFAADAVRYGNSIDFGLKSHHPSVRYFSRRDALMRANLAILEDAQETAGQSWTVYFDLEDSGSYRLQDGELFREEPDGTYTPVDRVRN